ncbi:hypothetical protein QYN14_00010 [Rhodococcus ruber]|uniref:hypothetical protein n=1 Tax=Rhodococcus ruber TaxID=1830 RepID=UPI002657ED48|nr:hypothetical protein [Rhodococcus ruber]WKK12041.1 hypothetical protein QYN14_00010 [Rhodococcus ruber]
MNTDVDVDRKPTSGIAAGPDPIVRARVVRPHTDRNSECPGFALRYVISAAGRSRVSACDATDAVLDMMTCNPPLPVRSTKPDPAAMLLVTDRVSAPAPTVVAVIGAARLGTVPDGTPAAHGDTGCAGSIRISEPALRRWSDTSLPNPP